MMVQRHWGMRSAVIFVILQACIVNAGIWKPVAALWPGNLLDKPKTEEQQQVAVVEAGDTAQQQRVLNIESLFSSKPKETKGWFGRTKKPPEEKLPSQELIEEATQLILKRQEAIQEEASKVMEQIEKIASEKSQSVQQSLISVANQRQQELVQEVERLSEWTERLLEDRAHRVEAHARATLQALDQAAVEEGRRIKLMGMALAEKTLGQAEQKALEGLSALEQNAIDQVVKLGAHLVERITKGKKKKETTKEILQRQFLGTSGNGRHLAWVRSSAVFLAILLAISPPYWERIGGNDAVRSVVPGTVASLMSRNPDSIRPLASATCALSAIFLTIRWPHQQELTLQRTGALLLFLICRFQTFETTLASICAVTFLLSEPKTGTQRFTEPKGAHSRFLQQRENRFCWV